jgi:hypothetical protein
MTAAAVVVVLVCERVFEFVSVCGARVRPAGLGSRDSAHREPLTASRNAVQIRIFHREQLSSRGQNV